MSLNQKKKQLNLKLQVPMTLWSIRWDISTYQRYHKNWCFLIREAADPSAPFVYQVGYQHVSALSYEMAFSDTRSC